MKKFIVLLIIICGTICAYGQNEKTHYLGGYVSVGTNDYYNVGRVNASYESSNYRTVGLNYSHRNSETIELCVGISYTSNDLSTSILSLLNVTCK